VVFTLPTPHQLSCPDGAGQEGNAGAGRYQLETALDVLARQGAVPGAEAVAAGYHYKLARWACEDTLSRHGQ